MPMTCKLNDMNKKLFTIFVLAVMVAAIHGVRFFKKSLRSPVPQEAIPNKAKGNPSAAIYVVEYSDFQCPACTYAAGVLTRFFEQHSSEMYVEFRHYPIPELHPFAITSAVFSECVAKQGEFWVYHDLLFEKRVEWSRSLRVRGRLMDMAEDIGLEMESFRACVEDTAVETKVLEEKSEGVERGVKATPTYFINDQMVVGARFLKKELQNLLDEGRL